MIPRQVRLYKHVEMESSSQSYPVGSGDPESDQVVEQPLQRRMTLLKTTTRDTLKWHM